MKDEKQSKCHRELENKRSLISPAAWHVGKSGSGSLLHKSFLLHSASGNQLCFFDIEVQGGGV